MQKTSVNIPSTFRELSRSLEDIFPDYNNNILKKILENISQYKAQQKSKILKEFCS